MSTPASLQPLPDAAVHSSRVTTVLGQNPGPMTLQGTNTYIIGSGKSRILLDTGEGVPAYLKNLRSQLAEQGVTSLSAILLSHWHHDHTGGLADVRALLAPGAQVYKGSGAAHLPAGVLAANPGLAESIQSIEDGQVFRTEGATLTAMATPGHTDDHFCFLLQEERAVFSGDTVLGAGTAVFSDLHSYLHSLRRIHREQPRRIYPAHGPLIDGAEAPQRIEQYISHRDQREQQILQLLQQTKAELQGSADADDKLLTTQQIVERIYQGIAPNLVAPATTNVLLHLGKLVKDGKVASLPSAPAVEHGASCDATAPATTTDTDDCAAEVREVFAAARERAQWRWKLL